MDRPEDGSIMYRATRTVLAEHFFLIVAAFIIFAALWELILPDRPLDTMSVGVLVWWTALCGLSVVNVCVWRISAAGLARRKASAEPAEYCFQRRQLLLSAIYVIGCAFRAVLPRADVQRMGFFDSWISSVMVGRSVATVAELCFVAQWALLLYKVAKDEDVKTGMVVAWLLVPFIVVAETCSWYAVLTTSYLGNVIEESIWALSATLLILSCLTLWTRCRRSYQPLLATVMVLAVGYVTFMCTVDIPMYASRYLADEASGRQYLSLSQGLWDVASRWHITYEWDHWRTEVPWMSLYFSLAVWLSIALIHFPRLQLATHRSRIEGK
jgi:hypothetical protein